MTLIQSKLNTEPSFYPYSKFIQSSNIGLPRYREFEERYALKYFAHWLEPSVLSELDHCYRVFFTRPKMRIAEPKTPITCDKDFLAASSFAHDCAQTILQADKALIYLDSCPKCQRLRITPRAKICLWCGHKTEPIT